MLALLGPYNDTLSLSVVSLSLWRVAATQGRLPAHSPLHGCVKWFSTVQSQDPKEGALNREGVNGTDLYIRTLRMHPEE